MEKRLWIAIALLIILPSLSFAQCTPDTSVSALYAPNESEGLPVAYVSIPYQTTITLNVPKDTSYAGLSGQIDRCVLLEVTGLPQGFTYSCFPDTNCVFQADSYGCILLEGYPVTNELAGTYDLVADFNFILQSPPISLPYELDAFTLQIDSMPVGLDQAPPATLSKLGVWPNPITSSSELQFYLATNEPYQLKIQSILGQTLYQEHGQGKPGNNILPLAPYNLTQGVYLLTLKLAHTQRSVRVIVP